MTQEGQDGIEKKTYFVTYIDGEEAERELKDVEVLQEKQDRVISYGMGVLSGTPSGWIIRRKSPVSELFHIITMGIQGELMGCLANMEHALWTAV